MNEELFYALDALQDKTGIPKGYMLEKVEAALLTAFKRDNAGSSNVKIVLDDQKKDMRVYQLKDVVETVENPVLQISLDDALKISRRYKIGSVAEVEVKPKNFGRISAQNAKQVIIQAIREAERGMLIKEYEGRKDEIISAIVYKIDPVSGNVVLDIGKGEAVLLKNEQIPGEVIREGERIKVYVIEVKNQNKGPLITLSRRHSGLVKRLFEMEVPEILDGTVLVKAITREAGSRTKMAVYSNDPNVDAVGACIGTRGARINSVVNELSGEKIDIVKYSDLPEEFIASALSPAEVNEVIITGEKTCIAVVPDNCLSLAIGKEGQNARLAAKLTGFKIDIKTPSTFQREVV